MASITGYCPVCTDVFNPERKRPHCIPCGHVFCYDCLTQTCYANVGLCPFCRTSFRTDEIRWLFFHYECDNRNDIPHYASSNSMESRTVLTALDWLHYTRELLEGRVLELSNTSSWNDEIARLQNEIQAWIEAYQALEIPHGTDSRPLELAAASLNFVSRINECLGNTQVERKELRAQLKKVRHDFRELRQASRNILQVNRELEIKVLERDIEIRALRDLNRLYRGASRAEPAFQLAAATRSAPQRPSHGASYRPHGIQADIRINGKEKPIKVLDEINVDMDLKPPVKKTVTWFRSSLRRSSAAHE